MGLFPHAGSDPPHQKRPLGGREGNKQSSQGSDRLDDRENNRRLVIKRLAALLLAAALLVPTASSTVTTAQAAPKGTIVQTYEKLPAFAVDMAWAPGTKTIFYTEKDTGKIRVIRNGVLQPGACRNLRVDSVGEQGALGIVLDPDYATNGYLYVYYSSVGQNDNRIARFKVVNDECVDMTVIFRGIPDYIIHNGGQLEFMGGFLFVTAGDAGKQEKAQDKNSLAGKVLRLNPDGSIPEDNPYEFPTGHPAVWSFGHRNGFGLATRGATDQLFESENGPGCDDELNKIDPAANYGWGDNNDYECGSGLGLDPVDPLRAWTPTIAPTDLAWYEGKLDAFDGTLLMSDYNDGNIHSFELNETGTAITDESIVHETSTSLMDVAKGPGGWVYFLTPGAIRRIRNAP